MMEPIKRKRKKKSKNYFTQDTEDAIVRYNNESDPEIRSKIYESEIHYAFFTLTQNIHLRELVLNFFFILSTQQEKLEFLFLV